MKVLVGAVLMSWMAVGHAGERAIEGAWQLDKWYVRTAAGAQSEFCKGAKGVLIYEDLGHVSTSINCPQMKSAGSEPADAYQRMFFYAGFYTVKDAVIYKKVTNASFAGLIGKTVSRKIE